MQGRCDCGERPRTRRRRRRRPSCRPGVGVRPSAHGTVDVVEEVLVAAAEVVQARLAARRADEAVFRAAAVASEADVALDAGARERVALVLAESLLLLGCDQVAHVIFVDVPEQVGGLEEVVAGVEVAGVLERERKPAGLGVDTQARRLPRTSWPARRRTSGRTPRRRRVAPTPRTRRSGSVRTVAPPPTGLSRARRSGRIAAGHATTTTGRRPRAACPPSGSASPGRASPSRGRSSTSSRGCTPLRSA